MPPQKGQQHFILKEGERAIVFAGPDSRLSLVMVALNAAGNVLVEGARFGLITGSQAARAFASQLQKVSP